MKDDITMSQVDKFTSSALAKCQPLILATARLLVGH